MKKLLFILSFLFSLSAFAQSYNEKGKWPCRPGGGKSFTIGNTLISGVVSTTYIDFQYCNRAPYNAFGEQILGGDTIKIYRNQNNGGVWNTINIGYLGGTYDVVKDTGCPVYIQPADTNVVEWRDYFRIGAAAIGDTNFVNGIKINGLANRQGNKYVYGFKAYKSTHDGNAIVANLFRNIEISGIYSEGAPYLMKKAVDTTEPWTYYPNYNIGPVYMHDIWVDSCGFEGFYMGSTDPDGNQGQGNFGYPAVQASDSSRFERIIITRAGWDALQLSSFGNGVSIKNVVTWKTGYKNQGSQQAMIFIGGYTNGTIDSCVMVNGSGGASLLGAGSCYIKNSIIDSVGNSGGLQDLIYNSQARVGTPPPAPDSLSAFVQNNVLARIQRYAVNNNNVGSYMKPGVINNNTVIDATRTTTLIKTNVAGETVTPNAYYTSLDISTTTLALSSKAWKVYQLVRANPPSLNGTHVSFFDVELFQFKKRARHKGGILKPKKF